jgi:alpha-amylase/alpha-mannosidase (GH57 family)
MEELEVKCYLMLLLHMHQPYYKDLRSGEYLLPWVRLHALRNYADIPAFQLKYPETKITYNLVPSLIEQIKDYAEGADDQFLALTRLPAATLTEGNKRDILTNFFQINRATHINPFPRYVELLTKKGSQDRVASENALLSYTTQDYLDLQVLYSLAWSGWLLREDPDIAKLLEKGKNFSEADKKLLLARQTKFLATVMEPYKQLQKNGQAELSVTPYYHPILPLLCDTESAHEAMPHLPLPATIFRHAEDAEAQIDAAITAYIQEFGKKPAGFWPSEGSISNEACGLLAKAGVQWAASDTSVLAHSLGCSPDALTAEQKYTPWKLATEHGDVSLFFRDTAFSDLLGFTYQLWDPKRAADDFIQRLRNATEKCSKPPVIPVILDGENPWEYYPDNGREFLDHLFRALQENDWIEMATPTELLANKSVQQSGLKSVTAGSWIYGTLTTWVGHSEKNRAWELLAQARQAYQENIANAPEPESATQELYIAEGSDWFWWFGDDHETSYAVEFDSLFRRHVSNIYHFLGLDSPAELLEPIKAVHDYSDYQLPLRLLSPTLDGKVSRYTEWVNAGLYWPKGGSGMMHQASSSIDKMMFGFDEENFYLRIDPSKYSDLVNSKFAFKCHFVSPVKAEICYDCCGQEAPVFIANGDKPKALEFGFANFLEIAVPWELLPGDDRIAFYLSIYHDGDEIETHPRGRVIKMNRSGQEFNAKMWSV